MAQIRYWLTILAAILGLTGCSGLAKSVQPAWHYSRLTVENPPEPGKPFQRHYHAEWEVPGPSLVIGGNGLYHYGTGETVTGWETRPDGKVVRTRRPY